MDNKFEKNIKPILHYVGTIGAAIMAIAYIIIICIMVFGIKATSSLKENAIFALVNAVIGFIIMQFLKVQGIDFAKELPENKALLNKYYGTRTSDKKIHSITYYWVVSTIKDVLLKSVAVALTTLGVVYIIVQGSKNYTLLLLALVNLLMFACFGFLSLIKAYEYYNNHHILYIKEKLKSTEENDDKN